MELNREDAPFIGKVQDLMVDQNLKCNLAYIKSNLEHYLKVSFV